MNDPNCPVVTTRQGAPGFPSSGEECGVLPRDPHVTDSVKESARRTNRLFRFVTASLLLMNGADGFGEWKPADSPLMTRWGGEVTPDNAWREYPRAQLVCAEWQSLNGLWDYAITGEGGEWTNPNVLNAEFDRLLKEPPAPPPKGDGQILAPFAVESALSGVGRLVRPDQLLWCRRAFEVPAKWQGRRIRLNFEAVDWHSIVWVNGRKMGGNKGGYTPFSFDITDALKPSSPRELTMFEPD